MHVCRHHQLKMIKNQSTIMLVYGCLPYQLLISEFSFFFFRSSRLCWLRSVSIFFLMSSTVRHTPIFSISLHIFSRAAARLFLSLYVTSLTFHKHGFCRYRSIRCIIATLDHWSLAGTETDMSLYPGPTVITDNHRPLPPNETSCVWQRHLTPGLGQCSVFSNSSILLVVQRTKARRSSSGKPLACVRGHCPIVWTGLYYYYYFIGL